MRTNASAGEVSAVSGDRLCYYCNEGRCALCNGWDRTVVDGQIVEVPCAHGCRQQARKRNQRADHDGERLKRNRA